MCPLLTQIVQIMDDSFVRIVDIDAFPIDFDLEGLLSNSSA